MTSLYQLRHGPSADFQILKLDADLNAENTYFLTPDACTCPAGHKSTCRHRKMLTMFQAAGHVDDGWLLDWDTRLWRHPIGVETDENGHQKADLADETTLPSERPSAMGEGVTTLPPAPTPEVERSLAPAPSGEPSRPFHRRRLG